MRKIHVIILAQGSQSRLPDLDIPKQFLPLASCGGMPILLRTELQLAHMNFGHMVVDVVCHERMVPALSETCGIKVSFGRAVYFGTTTLSDPGNSSLRGVGRFIARRHGLECVQTPEWDSTVVLLGDVVYSWACLEQLLAIGERGIIVATSGDLGPSSGELWGISWNRANEPYMRKMLDDALAKHPPFHDTYQPGQMRQWLYAMPAAVQEEVRVIVDDYTRDVDLPEHIPLLGKVSELAAADDAAHGLQW